jgi:spermidine synthase
MTPLASAVFFVSGFAALLYQVIWQRMLAVFSGADVHSATLIVTAFMGGLGIGNLAGGHVADRVSPRTSLLLFAAAELVVALFGFFSASLYYGYLYQRLGPIDMPPPLVGGVLFLSLLCPTFFMGASLPLLARALTHGIDRAASVIGVLYGVNALGAGAGAMVSTWWLLPRLGLAGSVEFGAVLNVVCAAVIVPFALLLKRSTASARVDRSPGAEPPPADGPAAPAFGFRIWAAVFALSGMLGLALEITWFRVLGVMVKSTAFTFGTLLALYLAGLGLGALAGSAVAPRVRRPAIAFLSLQAASALIGCALVAAFVHNVDGLELVWAYLGSYEPLAMGEQIALLQRAWSGSPGADVPVLFLVMYLGIPSLLVLPSTLLMGCSFPMLQRVVQTDLRRVGRRVGVLLLGNVLGSMAGAALTGWLLLDRFGTAGTLWLVALGAVPFAVLALRLRGREAPAAAWRVRFAGGAGTLAFAATLGAMPDTTTLWTSLHGARRHEVIVGEDGSGVSLVKARGTTATVFVNGLGQSVMPYGDVHTALGALPAFIHAAPKAAAIIGLGSGDTVHAAAGRRDLDTITCIEIVGSQIGMLRALGQVWSYDGLRNLLADPRVRHVTGDGRIHLMRGGHRYDIIEADALRPSSAYSGNLYSEEYFTLVRESLAPDGLAATWVPTGRVERTFLHVFPHVLKVPGIMIGSETPIAVDRQAIAARLAASGARDYYGAAGIDIERMFEEYLSKAETYGPGSGRQHLAERNTDLFPRDEFDLSRPR